MNNYYPNYTYERNNQNPSLQNNSSYYYPSQSDYYGNSQDDRFFLAPFLVGGLAGTALGYGIANNNQFNNGRPCCMQPMFFYPQPQQFPNMYSSNSNNFYY